MTAGAEVLTAQAWAKINLFLHVIARRSDGYHDLDSLVALADIGDEIQAAKAATLTLSVQGAFATMAGPDHENLVLRAAKLLRDHVGQPDLGASLTLTKNLPAGAGLGGGSADAAATLRVLNQLWRLGLGDEVLSALGLRLGADVPVCLHGHPCRMGGIGEVLRDVPHLPPLGVVLVHPGQALATPAVFKALAGRFSGPAPDPGSDFAQAEEFWRYLSATTNDLELPAQELCPPIGEILSALKGLSGCRLARMTGSGSACFGLFHDERSADSAAKHLRPAHAGWWIRAGRLQG